MNNNNTKTSQAKAYFIKNKFNTTKKILSNKSKYASRLKNINPKKSDTSFQSFFNRESGKLYFFKCPTAFFVFYFFRWKIFQNLGVTSNKKEKKAGSKLDKKENLKTVLVLFIQIR